MTFKEYTDQQEDNNMFAYELNYDIINAPDDVSLRNAFKDFLTSDSIGKYYIEDLGSGCLFVSNKELLSISRIIDIKFGKLIECFSKKNIEYEKSELIYSLDYIYQFHKFKIQCKSLVSYWLAKNKHLFKTNITNI